MDGLPNSGNAPTAPAYNSQMDPNVKAMSAFMESCFGKSAISGVMGFGMGGLFGMFMASMPWRRQLSIGFKDMGTRSWGMAKNFGKVGAMFSGIECGIEGFRAKNDLANGVAAGCLTGGILARSGGPMAMGGGCAAFAAFSLAIDAYMRSPGEE
ncbi:mitochondrial import inner membrane translocase subunit tim-22 [Apiospora phragmitis]|uniref:Mitochondrial import inner membrane translocase subunit TIM22 n=1 Tax=Apiospora phragmitis TaxID=2905665 RepID=A0ABR1UIE4_9PEZI